MQRRGSDAGFGQFLHHRIDLIARTDKHQQLRPGFSVEQLDQRGHLAAFIHQIELFGDLADHAVQRCRLQPQRVAQQRRRQLL